MVFYNLLTCGGFEGGMSALFGSCMKFRLAIALVFFIIALTRRYAFEANDIDFNFIIAEIAGILIYFILTYFVGILVISFVASVVGGIFLGYLFGQMIGGTGDGGGGDGD